MIWVSCEGENPADVENIGPVEYFPGQGFPGYYYPFMNTEGYLSPLVAIQFKRPTSKYFYFFKMILLFAIVERGTSTPFVAEIEVSFFSSNSIHSNTILFTRSNFQVSLLDNCRINRLYQESVTWCP